MTPQEESKMWLIIGILIIYTFISIALIGTLIIKTDDLYTTKKAYQESQCHKNNATLHQNTDPTYFTCKNQLNEIIKLDQTGTTLWKTTT
jgi:hypothetical protein